MNAEPEASVSSPEQPRRPPARIPTASALPATQRSPLLNAISSFVALAVLVGFGFLVHQMLGAAHHAGESEWSRALVIFNSVQALAFGAAGLLFGSRIEKANTMAASQVADQALENARLAVGNGVHLRRRLEEFADGGKRESLQASASELAELRVEAARLFPDD